jgi:hypothetical protein
MNSDRFRGELRFRALLPWEETQRVTKQQLFEITGPFGFLSSRHGWIDVPVGLITDLASIPPAVHAYLDAKAKTILAASVIHDYPYERLGVLDTGQTLTRGDADDVLHEACLCCGMRPSQAWVVRRMVGMFGGSRWKPTDIGNAA